jgi:type II secretory pathway pseudopilin PulG
VLNVLGRSTAERAKSIAIVILSALLLLSLWQASSDRAQAQRESRDRQAVTDVAGRFATALTTYDYAHPNIQMLAVAEVASPAVRARVSAAFTDLARAKASSIGDVTSSIVETLSDSRAEVLVRTSQVVSGSYAAPGMELSGMLDTTIISLGSGWLVSDYSWLPTHGGAP